MSIVRGELISHAYQHMVWVSDSDGRQYSCYRDDVKNFNENIGLTKKQKEKCLDNSLILGEGW